MFASSVCLQRNVHVGHCFEELHLFPPPCSCWSFCREGNFVYNTWKTTRFHMSQPWDCSLKIDGLCMNFSCRDFCRALLNSGDSLKRIQHDKFHLQLETKKNVWMLNPLQGLVKFRHRQKSAFGSEHVHTVNYLFVWGYRVHLCIYHYGRFYLFILVCWFHHFLIGQR